MTCSKPTLPRFLSSDSATNRPLPAPCQADRDRSKRRRDLVFAQASAPVPHPAQAFIAAEPTTRNYEGRNHEGEQGYFPNDVRLWVLLE